MPLVNSWVREDGVGYCAYGRALLIQHNLGFNSSWLLARSGGGRDDALRNRAKTVDEEN
jgi:hypothetical protein